MGVIRSKRALRARRERMSRKWKPLFLSEADLPQNRANLVTQLEITSDKSLAKPRCLRKKLLLRRTQRHLSDMLLDMNVRSAWLGSDDDAQGATSHAAMMAKLDRNINDMIKLYDLSSPQRKADTNHTSLKFELATDVIDAHSDSSDFDSFDDDVIDVYSHCDDSISCDDDSIDVQYHCKSTVSCTVDVVDKHSGFNDNDVIDVHPDCNDEEFIDVHPDCIDVDVNELHVDSNTEDVIDVHPNGNDEDVIDVHPYRNGEEVIGAHTDNEDTFTYEEDVIDLHPDCDDIFSGYDDIDVDNY